MIVRLFLAVAVLLVGVPLAIYLFTRDSRYLRLAWQFFRFFLVLFTAVTLFYVIERLVLI